MKRRTALALGALVTSAYLGVAVVTAHVSGHAVLPLYEAIPAPAYQWVHPPTAFATGNIAPKSNTTQIGLGATGNKEGGIASQDTQFIVTLNPGAIPPKGSAPSASMRIEPLDPATLALLPGGVRADGNAYRMTVTYDPSKTALAAFASNASIVLDVPLAANRGMFYSADGRSWTRIAGPAPASEKTTIGSSSKQMGIFLAGTTHRASATGGTTGGGSSGTSTTTVIIGVLVGLLLVGGGVWFLLRLVRPAPAPSRPGARPGSRPGSRPSSGRRPPPKRR